MFVYEKSIMFEIQVQQINGYHFKPFSYDLLHLVHLFLTVQDSALISNL